MKVHPPLFMQVSAAIVALCAIIALSKVDINSIHAEFEIVSSHPELLKYALNSNTLICGSLFLLACGGTLLYQIILLIVSFASKDQNTKVLSIVVSCTTWITIQFQKHSNIVMHSNHYHDKCTCMLSHKFVQLIQGYIYKG